MNSELNLSFKNNKFFIYTNFLFLSILYLIILNVSSNNTIFYLILWIFLFLLSIFKSFKFYLKINSIQGSWLLFLLYTFFITLVSTFFEARASLEFFKNLIFYLIPFLIILNFRRFCNRIQFLKTFRNFLSLISIMGIFEYFTKFQFYKFLIISSEAKDTFNIFGDVHSSQYRMTLFFGHPIYLGLLLDIFLLLLLFIPFKSTFLNILNILSGLTCLILTQARSAWLALFIVLIFYIIKEKKFKNINLSKIFKLIIAFFCLLSILGLIFYINPNLINTISNLFWNRTNSTIISPYQSSGARIANLNLIHDIPNAFVGIFGGGDNFAINLLKANPSINGWTMAIDNQYLTFLLNYGLFGTTIFLIFLFNCVKEIFKTRNNINTLILLSIFIILISGCFFEFFTSLYINYLLFILISFIEINKLEEK